MAPLRASPDRQADMYDSLDLICQVNEIQRYIKLNHESWQTREYRAISAKPQNNINIKYALSLHKINIKPA